MGNGKVLKAFRRKTHTEAPVIDWLSHDAMTKAEFRTEAIAYERLQNFPELSVYAPLYFGRTDPVDLLATFSDDASQYIRDCGLILEYIPGKASKLADLDAPLQQAVERIVERFRDEVGTGDVWDCSCFSPGTRAEFTVVDFSSWDGLVQYQLALNETGCLSPALLSQLEKEPRAR